MPAIIQRDFIRWSNASQPGERLELTLKAALRHIVQDVQQQPIVKVQLQDSGFRFKLERDDTGKRAIRYAVWCAPAVEPVRRALCSLAQNLYASSQSQTEPSNDSLGLPYRNPVRAALLLITDLALSPLPGHLDQLYRLPDDQFYHLIATTIEQSS